MRRMMIAASISIPLIFLMILSAFRSVRSALRVSGNLPFALVGAILTKYLLKINLSVSAAIGFIALFCIAVENGTALVTFFNQLCQQGLPTVEAVKKGCDLRLLPVLMIALTALLGLTRMIYATGSGSEIQHP